VETRPAGISVGNQQPQDLEAAAASLKQHQQLELVAAVVAVEASGNSSKQWQLLRQQWHCCLQRACLNLQRHLPDG